MLQMAPNVKKGRPIIKKSEELAQYIQICMDKMDGDEEGKMVELMEEMVKIYRGDSCVEEVREELRHDEKIGKDMLNEIPKFNGKVQELRNFILCIDRVIKLGNVSEKYLLKMLVLKMSDEGLAWYEYSGYKHMTWNDFKTDLKNSFNEVCPEIERIKLARRYQGSKESSKSFIWFMYQEYNWYFPTMEEEEVVNTIILNLRPEIKENLKFGGRIGTIKELLRVTNEAENFIRSSNMYNAAMRKKNEDKVAVNTKHELTCFTCGEKNHIARFCRKNKTEN